MRKALKTIICAASAAVICAAPVAPTFAGISASTAITAEAASFVTKSGSFVKFDENQINITVSDFNSSSSKSFGKAKSFTMDGVTPFMKQSVEFEITAPKNAKQSDIEGWLKNIRIKVQAYIDSAKKYSNSQEFTIQYEKISDKDGVKSYLCTCEFLAWGRSYTATIHSLDKNELDSRLSLSSGFAYGDADKNVWKVEAKTPSGTGNNIYAVVPKKKDGTTLSKANIKAWAKNACLLANSLSNLTGSKRDTVYIIFRSSLPDEYRTYRPLENASAMEYNYIWTGASNCAFIQFNEGESKELSLISSGITTRMNMTLIHEMGHAYNNFSSDNWAPNYNFDQKYGMGDEWFTEVRSLTAMYFCSNFPFNYSITDQCNETWYLNKEYPYDKGDDDYIWKFYKRLTNNIKYDKLKNFYNAGNALTIKNDRVIIKKFADKLKATAAFKNTKLDTSKDNDLRFVNSLVGLYGFRIGSPTEQNNFITNLNKDFKDGSKDGTVFLAEMYTALGKS